MAKKEKKKKQHKGRWELYESKGGLKRKNKSCPKCSQGTFMAKHKDRHTCGKCGYMEAENSEAVKEESSEKKTEEKKSSEKKK
jgi:small subunit ribosomal protein S27Ae